jgi:hypothetical protein
MDETVDIYEMTSHLQHKYRQRQHQPDPEPPRHIDQLVVGSCVGSCHSGLESHAADRAGTGTHLTDLRVHRAGINRALRDGRHCRSLVFKVMHRVGSKFCLAARGAKIVGAVPVLVVMRCRRWIHGHAADRIRHGLISNRCR